MRLECENSVNNRSQECEKLKVAHINENVIREICTKFQWEFYLNCELIINVTLTITQI